MSAGGALLLLVCARWAHFAGFASSCGVLAFRLAVLQPVAGRAYLATSRRLWRLVYAGILALLAAEVLTLFALALPALAQTTRSLLPAGRAEGQLLGQRIAVALLLWLLVGAARGGGRRQERWLDGGALLLALTLAALDGWSSAPAASTGSATPSALPVAQLLLAATAGAHTLAMASWAGALAGLIAVWRVPELAPRRNALAARVGRLALVCVVTLAGTGTALAVAHLPSPAALVDEAYGRALLAKLGCLAAALACAGAARWRREPIRVQWWRLEGLFLAAVLVLAALLITLPPPAATGR